MSTPEASAPPTIIVASSIPDTGQVTLRVTPHLAGELEELLRQHDPNIYDGRKLEFSATMSLAVLLLAAAPSLKNLAPVLVEFMHRHKDLEIQYGDHGNVIHIKGGSLKEMQEIVDLNAERQRQVDRQWSQIRDRPSPTEGG